MEAVATRSKEQRAASPPERGRAGRPLAGLPRTPGGIFVLAVLLLLLLAGTAPGLIAPHDPNEVQPDLALHPPAPGYWLGTDEFGRDILSRIIHATQLALLIAGASVALATLVGVPLGLVAGYYGGWADALIMRLADALLAFPAVLFAVLVVAIYGASALSIILTIAVIYLPRFARLVRGSVLVLRDLEFVTASRLCGASDARLLARTILPNCLPPILVQITVALGVAILVEAGLSYLGLGVQPPTATWGVMLRQAQSYLGRAPWYVLAPGGSIVLAVLALNLLGDALRDRLDPRLRGG